MSAIIALHNYLQVYSKSECSSSQRTDRNDTETGVWQNRLYGGLAPLSVIGQEHANDAKVVQETLEAYFNNEGRVPWQGEKILMY